MNQNDEERQAKKDPAREGRDQKQKEAGRAVGEEVRVPEAMDICSGVRRGGRRLVCGGPVTDPVVRAEVIDLLNEAMKRLIRWRVWDAQWIDEMHVKNMERAKEALRQLEGKYPREVIEVIEGIIDALLNHVKNRLKKYWINNVSEDVKRLIRKITNGGAKVIINKTDKSLTVHVYGNHVELNVNSIFRSNSVIVQLILRDLGGFHINVPDVLNDLMSNEEYVKLIENVVKSMRGGGFAVTDEGRDRHGNRPVMSTTQLWQVILWLLLYPGESHAYINAVNVNKSDVAIKWKLRARCCYSIKRCALSDALKYDDGAFLTFILAIILGDGDVTLSWRSNSVEPIVKFTINAEEFEKSEEWKQILNRLELLGIMWSKDDTRRDRVVIVIRSSYAINLVRKIIEALPPVINALFDVLEALGFEKWSKIKEVANTELRFKTGVWQVEIGGVKFSISIPHSYALVLRVKRCDPIEAQRIIDRIRMIYGEDFEIKTRRNNKGCIEIKIPWNEIKRRDDIKKVIKMKLCEVLALGEVKNEDMRVKMTNLLQKLAQTPTEGSGR